MQFCLMLFTLELLLLLKCSDMYFLDYVTPYMNHILKGHNPLFTSNYKSEVPKSTEITALDDRLKVL